MRQVPPAERATTARADVHAIWFVCTAVCALGAVAIALVSQHVFDMQPCPWCVLQRLVYLAIGALALLGLAVRRRPLGAGAVGGLVLALAICGVAAALWQSHAEKSASCNLTLADRIVGATGLADAWPDVFMARASCADAAVDLLGMPYWRWSVLGFVLCGLPMLGVLRNLRL